MSDDLPPHESSSPRSPLRLTVIICTRNRLSMLQRTVASVLPQLTDGDELLIVDNGSTDQTPRWLENLATSHPVVSTTYLGTPSIPRSRNLALEESRGEYLVSIDDDEVAEPDWLETYRAFLLGSAPPDLGCVGGPAISVHECATPCWLEPTHGTLDLRLPEGPVAAPIGPGAGNCAYVRSALLAINGYSEHLSRHEDTDLNNRLRAAGYAVWWLPEARVRHLIPPERLRFWSQIGIKFRDGRSAATLRLLQRPASHQRILFRLVRMFSSPPLAILELLGGFLWLCLGRLRAAAHITFRAARTIGFFCGLWNFSRTSRR